MKIPKQAIFLLFILIPTTLCQFIPSYDSKSYSPCFLHTQCCNMVDTNCCSSSGSCYTSWKRVCDSPTLDPKCSTVERKVCIPINNRACRTVIEKVHRNYTFFHCTASPLKKCFKFKRDACVKKENVSEDDIRWQNEKLVPANATTVRKCFDIKSVNCANRWILEKVRVPVKKQKEINTIVKQCTMKTIRGEDQVKQVPVTSIINRQVCWYVPKTKCYKMRFPCGYNCPTGLLCLSTEIQKTKTVCSIHSGDNCFQLSPPVCQPSLCQVAGTASHSGTVINYGNVGYETAQECCQQVNRKICRQVPNRVTKIIKKVIPGVVSARKVCQDVPIKKKQFYWDYEVQTVNKSRNDCSPSVKNECVNFMVQSYDIKVENVKESIKVRIPTCEHQEIDDEYCHTFAEGKVSCRNTTVPKSFKIRKIKCDVQSQTSTCVVVPVVDCQETYATEACRMVPKVICPSKTQCVSDQFCFVCEEFRTSIGFGSCPSNNCLYYNSADSWSNEMVANQFISQWSGMSGALVNVQPQVTSSNLSFSNVQQIVNDNYYLKNTMTPFQLSELADTDEEESINMTD